MSDQAGDMTRHNGDALATVGAIPIARTSCRPRANVRIKSRAVATNAPPHGAFRGFGAPQSIFALERHLDRIARALDITLSELFKAVEKRAEAVRKDVGRRVER